MRYSKTVSLRQTDVTALYKEASHGRPLNPLRATVCPTSDIYILCIAMERRFKIEGEITRQYRRFNAVGTQLTVRLQIRPDEENPVSHFLASVNDLFEHALQGVSDSDMVGINHSKRGESK